LGTGVASVLASPFLQHPFPSDLLHDLAQPSFDSPDFASHGLAQAADFESDLAQHDLAGVVGVSLLVLTFSVFDFSAEVTDCAETVLTVKAKIRANNEITRATFFIAIIY